MATIDYPQRYASRGGFSFSRVWDFASYYWPRLKWQIWIYLIVSVVCGGLILIPAPEAVQTGLRVAIWTLLPTMYFCAPLICAKGTDSRIVDRLVPANAAEKMFFFYFYFIIVVGAATFLIPYFAACIYCNWEAIQTPGGLELYDLKFFKTNLGLVLINWIGTVLSTVICFYVVEVVKHNRLLWGIVAVIASNTFVGLLGGILGAILAFKIGLEDGLKDCDSEPDIQNLTERVLEQIGAMDWMTSVVLAVLVVCLIVTAVLTYRTLKRRNL